MTKKEKDKRFANMARALGSYIESLGGTAAVVGGVSVGQHLGALKYNYFVQIDVTGIKPVPAKKKK